MDGWMDGWMDDSNTYSRIHNKKGVFQKSPVKYILNCGIIKFLP
jgi:hypothetical protein